MLERIKTILNENLDVEAESVTLETNFKDDLGLDSLDLLEMVMMLEDELNVKVPAEELEKMKTVRDVINYCKKLGYE